MNIAQYSLSVVVAFHAIAVFPTTSLAQIAVAMASDSHGHPSAALQRDCVEEQRVLKRYLSMYPTPQKWTFYVVCDEDSWTALVSRQIRNGQVPAGREIYGESFRLNGYTLFRGARFLTPDPRMIPEEIVAHELAHLYLNSDDEARVMKLVEQWMRHRHRYAESQFADSQTPHVETAPQ